MAKPNTAKDGCSGFSPDHLAALISNIHLACGKQKAAAPNKDRCSRFSATKNHRFRTCRPQCSPHLSSSPDLRIIKHTQPSQVSPMTDFRQMCALRDYSGGTARDLHPVSYSPAELLPLPQALKWNIYFSVEYHSLQLLSIEITLLCNSESLIIFLKKSVQRCISLWSTDNMVVSKILPTLHTQFWTQQI